MTLAVSLWKSELGGLMLVTNAIEILVGGKVHLMSLLILA